MDLSLADQNVSSSSQPSPGLQTAALSINTDLQEEQLKRQAEKKGIEYANLADVPINADCLRLLQRSAMEATRSLVLSRIGKRLRLAVVDAEGVAKDDIIRQLERRGYVVRLVLISPASFVFAQKLFDQYGLTDDAAAPSLQDKAEIYEEELERFKHTDADFALLPPTDMVRVILQEGYATGASDIHIDPQEEGVRLRFRIDGLVQEVFRLTPAVYKRFLGQLKYESHLKLNLSALPQDGRMSFDVDGGTVDVRVAILPTLLGETVSMRILDTKKKLFTLPELGFVDPVLTALEEGLRVPYGLMLVVGPTGSGKTTSLYTFIKYLQRPENRIVTLEDPIEYQLPGIAQSQVNMDAGYDFVMGLKALVRQDPDIMMVGEVREAETARIAFQAALTGHLVLTSLHAGHAVESLSRLQNIGLPPFMVAPALQTVLAQRLVRKLCAKCHQMREVTSAEQKLVSILARQYPRFFKPVDKVSAPNTKGCPVCSHTGYRGRTAIAEVVNVDENLRTLIASGASPQDVLAHIQKTSSFMHMRAYGIMRVLQGVTSFEEVYRVTGSQE